jgi:hypothetical protein
MLYLAIGSPLAGLEAWHGSGADVQPETAFSRFSENSGGGRAAPTLHYSSYTLRAFCTAQTNRDSIGDKVTSLIWHIFLDFPCARNRYANHLGARLAGGSSTARAARSGEFQV